MFTSTDGGASKDEAREVVIPLEQVLTGRLCLNNDMSTSYIMEVNVSRNIPKKWSATRPQSLHLHFLMHRTTILSNKTTSEQENRCISTEIEAVSVIGNTDHQFDGYSNCQLLVLRVDCCLSSSSHCEGSVLTCRNHLFIYALGLSRNDRGSNIDVRAKTSTEVRTVDERVVSRGQG